MPQLQTLSTSSAVSAVTDKTRIQPSDKVSRAHILVGIDEQLKTHEMPRRLEMPIRESIMWRVVVFKAVFQRIFELTVMRGDPRSQFSEVESVLRWRRVVNEPRRRCCRNRHCCSQKG